MQSAARLERVWRWCKPAWLAVVVVWLGVDSIAGSASCSAQGIVKSADRTGISSKDISSRDPAATAVFIVEEKKCRDKAPQDDPWSESEQWAWQQICGHLNVDFDEKEANAIVDDQIGKESPARDDLYLANLEKLRNQNPQKLAADASRRLSNRFLAMIFGDPELREHTWNTPLKFFGFSTDRFVIDTAALKALDIRHAYVGSFSIENANIDGDLRFEDVHLASIRARFVTANRFLLNNVSVAAKNSGSGRPSPAQWSLNGESQGTLEIDTARIGDRLSISKGDYDFIDLKHVKVDDLFIRGPSLNGSPESSKPELSIAESVDNGVFTLMLDKDVKPTRIMLSQFIFANAYLGPNPMPVISAMETDAAIRRKDVSGSRRGDDGRSDLEPYTLIAQSYAKRGETGISDQILIARNNQDWHRVDIPWLDFLGLTFTWLVADYGFHPERGFWWILGFVLLGWGIFWYASGSLAAGSYRPKNSFLLALDSVIPGINLDKNHEDVRYEGWPQIMLYLLRILGAVLFFVALGFLQKKLLG